MKNKNKITKRGFYPTRKTHDGKCGLEYYDSAKYGFWVRLPKTRGDGKWRCHINDWGHTGSEIIPLGNGWLWFSEYWDGIEGMIMDKPVRLDPLM